MALRQKAARRMYVAAFLYPKYLLAEFTK